MNIHQVGKISLSPNVVDCLVFWTKNPERFYSRLNELNSYYYYFQYTITGYGKSIEPNVPALNDSIDIFIKFSKKIGKNRMVWRYDPIILTENFTVEYHIKNFENIATQFSKYTKRCVISFIDYYKNIIKNISPIQSKEITNEQLSEIASAFSIICQKNNIELVTCAEEVDLSNFKISHGKCIDDKLIEEISGFSLNVDKDKNQRLECGCVASIDIGTYNTCPHGCLYCYANYSCNQVRKNYSQHNRNSPLLYGQLTESDKVTERKVISCREAQKLLFKL
jgi:DNA repair photolyase